MEKKKKLKKKKEEGDAREEEELRRPRGGGRGEGRAQKKRERDAEEEEEETSRVASSLVVHSPPRGVSRPQHFIKGAEERERKKERKRACVDFLGQN